MQSIIIIIVARVLSYKVRSITHVARWHKPALQTVQSSSRMKIAVKFEELDLYL